MKIPKKLKIGGFIYQVIESQEVVNEGDAFGSFHSRQQKLFIDPNETQQKKEQTLLHEIFHAIFWQTGLLERMKDIKEIKEEEIIQALAMGLYQTLKDNQFLRK